MPTAPNQATWVFDPALPSGARSGGNAAQRAFSPTLEALVREVLQNSKDAGEGRDVGVVFRLIELSGASAQAFLKMLSWSSRLRPHIEGAAREPRGEAFRAALSELDSTGKLVLLAIEDRNTTGLLGNETGEEGGSSKFSALVRDEMYSAKSSDTAGGSHGMGKAVLWHFSGFSTVLFNSVLEASSGAPENPRFIGRAVLPWHKLPNGNAYDGGGWFGAKKAEPHRAESVWGNSAQNLSNSLNLTREHAVSGTSVLIVGFREPAEADRTLRQTADEIERATAKWFWPSLTGDRARLNVSVEVIRDGKVEHEDVVDAEQYNDVRPFIEAVRTFRNCATVESLEAPGDVAVLPILFDVPAHKRDEHDAFTASVTLVARLAEPDSVSLEHTDHVAYFRGAGMVVEYRSLKRLSLTARPFHAAVVCGEANGGTAKDRHLDMFLRAAEPPEHNKWTSPTDDLKNSYKLGYGKAIADLNKSVREKLRAIVSEKSTGGEQGPEKLMRRFRIGSVGGGGGGRVDFDLVDTEAFLNENGFWEFRGKVVAKAEVPNGWRANLAVRYANEDNTTGTRIAIKTFDAGSLRAMLNEDKATVMVPPGIEAFNFSGTVDARRQAVDPQFATLVVSATGTTIKG